MTKADATSRRGTIQALCGMGYRLYAVRIFTYRWQDSVEFYRDVVGLPLTLFGEDVGWAQFDLGSAILGLERCSPDDPEAKALVGRFIGITIEVQDIQSTYESLLAKGVEFTGPPEKQPWGGILAHFKDLDGNVITLLGAGA